jgi:hypothetical protein
MSYLFHEAKPFTNGQPVGKCKGVLLTNTNSSKARADLICYSDLRTGATYCVKVEFATQASQIFHIGVWGVSAEAGITGAVLA